MEVIWKGDGTGDASASVAMFTMSFGETRRLNTFLNHVFAFRTDGRELARRVGCIVTTRSAGAQIPHHARSAPHGA